jgi:hypothetical protein
MSFFHIVSAVFGCLGAWYAIDQLRFESSGMRAEAQVVGNDTHHTTDKYGRPQSFPMDMLEFSTSSGRVIRFYDVGLQLRRHREIGQKVEIFYPGTAPERARVAGAMTPPSLIAWGVALTLLAVAWLRRTRLRK